MLPNIDIKPISFLARAKGNNNKVDYDLNEVPSNYSINNEIAKHCLYEIPFK